jgi:microcystin-dependent protein
MSSPFLGEIRAVGFAFAPSGWATCDGQILAIQQNTALFSLLGVNFGGNGTTNYGLPNLQGSAPVGWGQGRGLSSYTIGDTGGAPNVTIDQTTTPVHHHNPFYGDNEPATESSPNGNLYAGTNNPTYGTAASTAAFAAQTVQALGGGEAHENMAPYQTLLYVICLSGDFPARN